MVALSRTAGLLSWAKDLKSLLPRTKLDEPLKPYCTWRIGGPADAFLEAGTLPELAAAAAFAREHGLPLFLLGWGSNLLVRDGGIRGLVVKLAGDFDHIARAGDLRVHAGAAVRLPRLVSYCAAHGLAGSEPLVGVPGTVGGALVMNAGTREGEIGALTREIVVLEDGERRVLAPREAAFSYRHSALEGRVVLGATLELKAGDKGDIMTRVRELQQRRLKTQPVHSHNVGSVFKNPPGRFAAQLIEESGLKGLRVGGAAVSARHANFIENTGGATARDVLELIAAVRERVRARSGVALELEVKVVGEA